MNGARQVLLALVAVIGLGATLPAPAAARRPYHVFMILWRGCDETCSAFQEYFSKREIPVRFTIRDAALSMTTLRTLVAEAKAARPDLVVPWGTPPTVAAAGQFDGVDPARHITKVPIVFMAVTDPVGAKLVKNARVSGRKNVTGVHFLVGPRYLISTLNAYRKVERVGLVWNPMELSSWLAARAIRQEAQKAGLKVIQIGVSHGADGKPSLEGLQGRLNMLRVAGVDFAFVATSSFLLANARAFTKLATDEGVALVTPDTPLVIDAHALLAIGVRRAALGESAARQAEQILVEGKKPISLPMRSPGRVSYIINMETARRLRQYPPLQLLRFAEIINPTPGAEEEAPLPKAAPTLNQGDDVDDDDADDGDADDGDADDGDADGDSAAP